jgi:2-C-methyl-D-erythritol 4-phosphate cytidylyltransferase
VESLGVRIKLVETPGANLKVTVPSDLAMAQLLLKGRT